MSPANDNTILHDALEHDVHAVTIYQENYAQITRKIKVDLKAGRNAIVIKNLPFTLVPESVKAVSQEGIVFDIIHESTLAPSTLKRIAPEIENQRFAVEDEIAILEEQIRVLNTVNKSLTLKETQTDELLEYLDAYGNRQHDINEKKQKLQIQSEQISDEISEAYTKNANEQSKVSQTNIKVTVVMLAETNCEVEITFIYLVSGASWVPQYDVNACIAKDFKTQSSIDVNYRAVIRQYTNEDWTEAIISLSTIVPSIRFSNQSVTPYPSPIGVPQAYGSSIHPLPYVSVPQHETNNSTRSSSPIPYTPVPLSPFQPAIKTSANPLGTYTGFDSNRTSTSVGTAGTTFTVPGLCTLQSSYTQSHTVHIAKSSYDSAEFYYFTQPSKSTEVHLQSVLQNTTPFTFMKGEVRVSMNDDFVTTSTMDIVYPGGNFICSFGTQPDIQVTYPHQDCKCDTKRKQWFGSYITTAAYKQKISIKNLSPSRIEKLVVRGTIPVKHSWNPNIKLTILEPAGLSTQTTNAGGNASGSANEKTNNSVKWVDDEDSKCVLSHHRFMEWICSLERRTSIELTARWETIGPGM